MKRVEVRYAEKQGQMSVVIEMNWVGVVTSDIGREVKEKERVEGEEGEGRDRLNVSKWVEGGDGSCDCIMISGVHGRSSKLTSLLR
jgi:hypothetical protein